MKKGSLWSLASQIEWTLGSVCFVAGDEITCCIIFHLLYRLSESILEESFIIPRHGLFRSIFESKHPEPFSRKQNRIYYLFAVDFIICIMIFLVAVA